MKYSKIDFLKILKHSLVSKLLIMEGNHERKVVYSSLLHFRSGRMAKLLRREPSCLRAVVFIWVQFSVKKLRNVPDFFHEVNMALWTLFNIMFRGNNNAWTLVEPPFVCVKGCWTWVANISELHWILDYKHIIIIII